MLSVSGVSKSFGGIHALRNVDIVIEKGQIHGIIGPNGSGKTTLFNVVTGLLYPDEGNIQFESQDITHLKPDIIANMGISRTFQGGQLVASITVIENVMAGLYEFTKKEIFETFFRRPFKKSNRETEIKVRAYEALRLVHMEESADRWANDLVWAERQFVQIARSLISKPKLLLLDEPASGMGAKETERVEKIIRQLCNIGITVVIVSHDVRMLMGLSDWVTVINFGERISEGIPDQIQRDPAVLEAYLGTES